MKKCKHEFIVWKSRYEQDLEHEIDLDGRVCRLCGVTEQSTKRVDLRLDSEKKNGKT